MVVEQLLPGVHEEVVLESGRDVVISVNGLGKQYRIGEFHGGISTLKGSVKELLGPLLRRKAPPPDPTNVLWALRNVSFDVRRGEGVAIVGRNGSGKSTLLQILSRAIYPTEGSAEIRGRVASLLAMGAGFNPEFTGRENVFMSGVMLGHSAAEIRRRMDMITEFAGIGRFLDTPVKRYSSGMYVRLAFAVASHVDADILLADEVLAVGDVEFQEKCMARMEAFVRGGGTLLFVSHSASAVAKLCTRVIYLSDGVVVEDGPAGAVLDHYRSEVLQEPLGPSIEL